MINLGTYLWSAFAGAVCGFLSAVPVGPINLTILEQRSGYSRRFLQLAFQQRFGCGPMQWIRQQRLEQARLSLLNPQDDDSVGCVAARFGFSSVSVFSREFHRRFGSRPSDVLREGRRFSP